MLAVDGSFSQLAATLSALQVRDLGGSQSYFVLLLCPQPLEACINGTGQQGHALRDQIAAGDLAILSPYGPDWVALMDREVAQKGMKSTDFMALMAAYNACYGFCLGTSLNPSPDAWAANPKEPAFGSTLRGQTIQGTFLGLFLPDILVRFFRPSSTRFMACLTAPICIAFLGYSGCHFFFGFLGTFHSRLIMRNFWLL